MYVEGITDLMKMILMFPFSPPEAKEKNLDSIKERATNRYFPVFEKVSDSEDVPVKVVLTNTKQLRVCSVGQFQILSFLISLSTFSLFVVRAVVFEIIYMANKAVCS